MEDKMNEKEIKIEEDELLEVLKNMTSKDLEKLIEELESVEDTNAES